MADLTLNEYEDLDDEEIRFRLLEEYNNIYSGKVNPKPTVSIKSARDRGKRFSQFILRQIKTIIPKKKIPLEENQFFYKWVQRLSSVTHFSINKS